MQIDLKKISIITATTILGLTLTACSTDDKNENTTPTKETTTVENAENNASTDETENTEPNDNNENNEELISDEENAPISEDAKQVASVFSGFFDYLNEPLHPVEDTENEDGVASIKIPEGFMKDQMEGLSSEEKLVILETDLDVTPYFNYPDLSTDTKVEILTMANNSKFAALLYEFHPQFTVDPSGVTVNENAATIDGTSVKIGDPEESTETLEKELVIHFIKTDNGWRIDGEKFKETL